MKTLEQLAREAEMTAVATLDSHSPFSMYLASNSDLARFRAAVRAEVLEEASLIAERVGVALCDTYGDGAECIRTGEECAAAIREAKGEA